MFHIVLSEKSASVAQPGFQSSAIKLGLKVEHPEIMLE
jgi:hypothetical protein